jgi:hypothetical protein
VSRFSKGQGFPTVTRFLKCDKVFQAGYFSNRGLSLRPKPKA